METPEYSMFSAIYDDFMDNISYDTWFSYIHVLLMNNGIEKGTILDLGCGTGEILKRLENEGYDTIGLDYSSEMLEIAREKCEKSLLLNQDMREMELFGTVDAVVSVCDSLNYILERDEIVEIFKKVNNYLEKDGIFIFDMKTSHFFEKTVGDSTVTDCRDNAAVIWENEYDSVSRENISHITMFIKDDENKYDRYEEDHVQKAYLIEDIVEMISEAGLELVASYNAFTGEKASEEADRVYFVAKEGFQKGKLYI
ncbi:MAG: class I SAM-dependent methyltransferase [Lachnospiraceae bacterium]|nr:class I SAM-dependent methyltransferase [Lachnospiraceae bacterium]